MANNWYPQDKKELDNLLKNLMHNNKKEDNKKQEQKINGLIVPHAGYIYSGEVAGKAFSLLKNLNKKNTEQIKHAIILGPSHYTGFYGIRKLEMVETPLGKVKINEKIIKNEKEFEKISYEHSVDNQIPFLQKLNPEIEILPLVVGEISDKGAEEFAEKLSEANADTLSIFSTDLSHFLPYAQAIKTDEKTIDIIENLDIDKIKDIDACGIFPLMIMMHLCRIKKLKPKLIEYKNSGDITGDKSSVVGYASFWF